MKLIISLEVSDKVLIKPFDLAEMRQEKKEKIISEISKQLLDFDLEFIIKNAIMKRMEKIILKEKYDEAKFNPPFPGN